MASSNAVPSLEPYRNPLPGWGESLPPLCPGPLVPDSPEMYLPSSPAASHLSTRAGLRVTASPGEGLAQTRHLRETVECMDRCQSETTDKWANFQLTLCVPGVSVSGGGRGPAHAVPPIYALAVFLGESAPLSGTLTLEVMLTRAPLACQAGLTDTITE